MDELIKKLTEERDEARAEVERLRAEAAPTNEHFSAGYRDGYRDGYRRGAAAMREACAAHVGEYGNGYYGLTGAGVAKMLRALPIPEEQ